MFERRRASAREASATARREGIRKASPAPATSLPDPFVDVGQLTGAAIQAAINSLDDGGTVRLVTGRYEVSEPLRLPNSITILGEGPDATVLALAPDTSQHLLTNVNAEAGGRAVHLRSFTLLGRSGEQPTPPGHDRYPFSCGCFFRNMTDVRVTDVVARDIRNTAFHFDNCRNVRLSDVETHGVGWSGVSTTGTDDIEVTGLVATDSGRDVRHSAIHLDGGVGGYIEATIEDSTGTGVMVQAFAADLEDVVVHAKATRCRIGLSVTSGSGHIARNVVATGTYSHNRDTGVLVANAERVQIIGAVIEGNASHGIRLQGAQGAQHCLVADCTIESNPVALEERDASRDNLISGNSHQREPSAMARARRRLRKLLKTAGGRRTR